MRTIVANTEMSRIPIDWKIAAQLSVSGNFDPSLGAQTTLLPECDSFDFSEKASNSASLPASASALLHVQPRSRIR